MNLLPFVIRARYDGGFRIHLTFNDNLEGTLDLEGWLEGPVFEPLKDRDYFQRFFIDGGTLVWPNGADIAPETLYEAVKHEQTAQPRARLCENFLKTPYVQRGRRITRWEDEAVLERMEQRVSEHPEIMRKRKMLAEHPFGTIKRWMDQSYFLMRGQEQVSAEASLTVLAYNIKRVINILGVTPLVRTLA